MISIIVTSHNYGKYIVDCLDSILLNNKKFITEIIVINDASSDNTESILKEYPNKNNKIKYYTKNYYSLSKSLNFGISIASSKIITKIDADDWIENNFLEKYYNYLIKNNYDFIYGNLKIINETNKKTSYKNQYVSFFTKKIKYPCGSGTIFKKKVWEKIGGFNEYINSYEDCDFSVRAQKMFNTNVIISKSFNGYHLKEYNFIKLFLEVVKKTFNFTRLRLLHKNYYKNVTTLIDWRINCVQCINMSKSNYVRT